MRYLKELILSKEFLKLAPCQELLSENYTGANYMSAAKGQDYAFIYSPNGLDIKINMGVLNGSYATANWFDPRKGGYHYAGINKNENIVTFTPPSSGRNNDWVLVLQQITY